MRKLLSGVVGLSLWLTLLLGVVDFSARQIRFYETQYQRLAVAETIGITSVELMRVTETLLEYIAGDRSDLDVSVVINANEVKMFNQRELDHMVDVQVLYVTLLRVLRGAALVFVLSLGALWWRERKQVGQQVWQGFLLGATIIGTVLGLLAAYALLDFRSFWINFHEILFTNDLWLLNPNTDRLILMVPEPFFVSLVSLILARLAILVGLVSVALKGWAFGLNHRWLKWFALLTMTIDHIGYLLYPELIELRMVGRLAFPIFTFLFAYSLRLTSQPKRFQKVLWISAGISQVAFYAVGLELVSILFLFAIATHVVEALHKRQFLFALGLAILLELAGVDYGLYGLITILWFYHFQDQKYRQALGFLVITWVFNALRFIPMYGISIVLESLLQFSAWGYQLWVQALALLAFIYLFNYDAHKPKTYSRMWLNSLEKYSFYVYYPAHLVLLSVMARGL